MAGARPQEEARRRAQEALGMLGLAAAVAVGAVGLRTAPQVGTEAPTAQQVLAPSQLPSSLVGALPTAPPPGSAHEVAPGDTASAIAGRYGVTVEALAQVNDLADPAKLEVGQVLRIPRSAAAE
jgi:LysM repeat protein